MQLRTFFGGQLYLLKDDAKPQTTIKLSTSKATIYVKNTKKIKATINNGVGTTTYKSSKKTVATVSKKGKVTAVKRGKTTITVKANGRTLKCKIKVKKR